jgi:hypothetical protein
MFECPLVTFFSRYEGKFVELSSEFNVKNFAHIGHAGRDKITRIFCGEQHDKLNRKRTISFGVLKGKLIHLPSVK